MFIRFQVLPLTVIRMSSSIRRLCWNCASSSWCAKLPVKAGSSGLAAFTSSGLTFGDFMCNFRSVSSEDPWWPESWRLTTIWLGVGLAAQLASARHTRVLRLRPPRSPYEAPKPSFVQKNSLSSWVYLGRKHHFHWPRWKRKTAWPNAL